jgi:tetratricopeptide (TPR) repeat protein
MPALTFYSSPRADRSFTIALGLVILFGAVELGSFGFFYARRIRPVQVAPAPATAVTRTTPAAPPPAVAQASASPAAPAPASTPSTSVLSASDRLLKEAAALRERGDTTDALARLQAASEKDPKNAHVLAEMATIYESILNFDRSNETWRRIQEIGPSAGQDYELALAKLSKGATAPGTGASNAVATTTPPAEGIPGGAVLGISEITTTENADPDSDTNMLLRISVKKRDNTVIDHTKVKIQVYFYDSLPNNDIKLTDADVSYEWLTPNHDWTDTNPEVLAVTYVRAKNKSLSSEAALAAAAASVNPARKGKTTKPSAPADAAQRKYLGYIVRIYYNDQLQDKRAEPTKLLTLFPPPFTASSP